MLKPIKSIDIIFENLESARVDVEDIAHAGFYEITQDMTFCCEDEMYSYYSCEFAFIAFKNLEQLIYKAFRNEKRSLFDRLSKFNDVIKFCIIYRDDTRMEILAPYSSQSLFYNLFQKLYKIDGIYFLEIDAKQLTISKLFSYWFWKIKYTNVIKYLRALL